MKKAILILFLLSCCSSNERVIESADTTTTSTLPPKNLEIEKAYYACGLDSNTSYNYLEEENLIVINGTNPTSLMADTEKINNLCIFQYLKFPDYLVTRLTSFIYLSNVQKVELENLQVSWFYNRNSGYTIGISDILGPGDKVAVEREACSYGGTFSNFRAADWLFAHNDGVLELSRWASGDSFSEDERTNAQSKIQTFYDKKKKLDDGTYTTLDPKKYAAAHPELTKLYDFLTGVAIEMGQVDIVFNSYLDGNDNMVDLMNFAYRSYNKVAKGYVSADDEYYDSCY